MAKKKQKMLPAILYLIMAVSGVWGLIVLATAPGMSLALDKVYLWLLAIGGLNWGLKAFLGVDLIEKLGFF